MTDREKLVDILERAGAMRRFSGSMASILIEHGVTFREWIPVTESLPADGTSVLCAGVKGGLFIVVNCEAPTKDEIWINGHGWRKFTHWMYLPEPPREVKP